MIHHVVKINGVINSTEFVVADNQTVGLTENMCLTVDEIVYDIISKRLSDDDKLYFKGCSIGDLTMEHLGFGMWIRNTYALWDVANPLTEVNPAPDSNKHPDNCSMNIMELVRETLNGRNTLDVPDTEEDFNEAMKILGGK